MAKVKYLQKVVNKFGRVSWRSIPSKVIRDALPHLISETWVHLEDAVIRCQEIEAEYQDYLKGKHPTISKDENTVSGFIRYYKTLLTYENLAPNSKVAYNMLLRQAITTKIGNSRHFLVKC